MLYKASIPPEREENDMFLFQRIEEIAMQYQDSRREVAEFILKERSRLGELSMQEIAEKTFTSKPTLVRFAKTLGFAGWREFMKEYAEEERYQVSHYTDIDPNLPFDQNDSTRDIVRKVGDLQVESILDTADLLDASPLDLAVDRIVDADRIVFFGMSPNNYLADIFRRKMQSIGRFVTVAKLSECGMTARSLTPRDCAVLISYSGNNEDRVPMKYVKALKERGVPLIAVTSGGDNYLRSQIDCVLTMSSREKLYSKIAGFSTEISILCILNVLFSCCFARDYKKNLEYKIRNSLELESARSGSLSEMREEPGPASPK